METPLGIRLKKARKKLGMTLTEVADATGYSPAYICRIEGGTRQNINYQLYAKLVQLYELADGTNDNRGRGLVEFDILSEQIDLANESLLELVRVQKQILSSCQGLIHLNSMPEQTLKFTEPKMAE